MTIERRSVGTVAKKLGGCLTELSKNKILSPDECNLVETEYRKMVLEPKGNPQDKCQQFEVTRDRLDDFYGTKVEVASKYPTIWKFMQIVFTLPHRQASVERGSSINADTLQTNMGKKMLIARRFSLKTLFRFKIISN